MSKTSIPAQVKQLLFGMAAGRCEYLGCNRLLTKNELGQRGNFSVFAHIVADEPGGPRGDPTLSPKLAKDIGNLMLLCLDHHRFIDVDDPDGHPVEKLQEMKARHEERIRRLTECDDNHRTLLVLMAANIGDRKGIVSVEEARKVVHPKYPVDDSISIDLARLHVSDGEDVAWKVGIEEITEVAKYVQKRLVRDNVQHLSIFALAPIPLLMFLGKALGDIAPGEVYQRHRTLPGWLWQPASSAESEFKVVAETTPSSPNVSLIFSVSDEVDLDAVRRAAPNQPHYIVRLTDPKPDLVRTREQVVAFREKVRDVLRSIREQHGSDVTVHVFPALPNSLAVEFGRVLLPKSDPQMKVYDFNRERGGWKYAITLLEPAEGRS